MSTTGEQASSVPASDRTTGPAAAQPALRQLLDPRALAHLEALRSVLPAVLLVLAMAVATHSVVRYLWWIVAAYTALALAVAAWVSRSDVTRKATPPARPTITAAAGAIALIVAAGVSLTVRSYTYLHPQDAWQVRCGLALVAALCATLLLLPSVVRRAGRTKACPADLGRSEQVPGRVLRKAEELLVAALRATTRTRRSAGRVPRSRPKICGTGPGLGWAALSRRAPDAALATAVLGYVGAAVALIHLDPTPKIDVWVTLQQATDATWRGENIYTLHWVGSPGVQDAFTYLPMTAVLLAPGRWLAGDVRWALVAVTLVATALIRTLPGRAAPAAAQGSAGACAALLLLLPGTSTQVEQAWTEPLLLACLAGWAWAVQREHPWIAVACLALGLASKQHLAVLLPVLAAWPRFGPRRAAWSALLAGIMVLPWFVASPRDMWHDTVSLLVSFQPLRFADTLYIAAMHELHWEPPFWLTGALVLGTLLAAVVVVHRRNPSLPWVLRWCALVLLVANLVNKQAFYNQYWLVAALILLSWAIPVQATPGSHSRDQETLPANR